MTVLVEVAVALPLRRTLSYRVPENLQGLAVAGARVLVPVGRRRVAGTILGPARETPREVRDVDRVFGDEPPIAPDVVAFLRMASDYYLHPLGEVIAAATPAGMRTKSAMRLRLTEVGKKSAALFEAPTPEGRAIAALRTRPRSLRALLAVSQGLGRAAIDRLIRDGVIERTEVVTGARHVRIVEVLVRIPGDPPPRLGVRQREVLQRLETAGEIPMAELRVAVRGARAAAKALVDRGVARIDRRDAPDPFLSATLPADTVPRLNAAQDHAAQTLKGALASGSYSPFLLFGVTGSGKTEVYLRLVAEALALGKGAVVLVPEIALTPQLSGRFRARLGDAVAVLHSGLGERERLDAWRSLLLGRRRVALGARSALFAPVRDLAVVVVDEEHDGSFKQEEGFRYHARDLALVRAQIAGGVAVLGSATPSMESWANTLRGKLGLLELPERATPLPLPPVEIVSRRTHRMGPTGHPLLTAPLVRAMEETLAAKGQAILFLNRRGFAPSATCEACGEAVPCPSCSVSLVHHRASVTLRCHYCDHTRDLPERCPSCGEGPLALLGYGTEQVEGAVKEAFPQARVGRLDRDVAIGRGAERVLGKLRDREIDVLVGTQMVAKGHDFPGVTLVGVLAADVGLRQPDFRAAERTFQLLCQVAGRAGRGDEPGRVIVQALAPSHHAIRLAAAHDFRGFYEVEAPRRDELGYPPSGRLAAVIVDGPDEARVRESARAIGEAARAHAEGVTILGPAPAPLARLRGRYRFRLLLRARRLEKLRACLLAFEPRLADVPSGVRAAIDVDPVSML